MKKYFLLSAVALLLLGALISCVDRTNEAVTKDNDTYSKMRDVTGTFTSANSYSINQGIDIPNTDVVLVYRNVNSNTNNTAVWQLLPKMSYLSNNRELEYNFVFNTQRIQIRTESNFDANTMTLEEANIYLNNQTFRIVLVPASSGKNANLDYSDYNAVVRFYNLKEPK